MTWRQKEQIENNRKTAEQKAMRDFVRTTKGIVEINPYTNMSGIRYPEAEGYTLKTTTRVW